MVETKTEAQEQSVELPDAVKNAPPVVSAASEDKETIPVSENATPEAAAIQQDAAVVAER